MIGGFCEGKRRKGSGFSGLLVPSLPLIASRQTFRRQSSGRLTGCSVAGEPLVHCLQAF
jgi:predicted ester cyclase